MSQVISSNNLPKGISPEESLWIYNGLDGAATLFAWERMQKQQQANSNISYSFVSGMRGPALEMMMRGIRIDLEQRQKFLHLYQGQSDILSKNLNMLAEAVWDKGLNPASPKQMQDFLYHRMKLPQQYKFYKGEKKVSCDRDALEKLQFHFHAQPIVNTVLSIREVDKKLQFLHSGISEDFRCRTSYNVVGTETARWSSSEDSFGDGTNQQNITDELRQMFIADDGQKLGYSDLEQAESRVVAYRSGDLNYIAAFNSGDLHTTVAKMVWPNLGWTGDLAHDRKIADRIFYRHFTYRDIAKRLGHATNYNGAARTLSRILKIPEELVQRFQDAYFTAFPGIRRWHHEVARQLQTKGYLITALGRKRNFLGRRFDDETLREAIAYEPQSTVGEMLNLYLWRIWRKQEDVQCLAQIHDAVLLQFPQEKESIIIPQVLAYAKIPVAYPAGIMTIPSEASTGWNWAKASNDNINGLRKYKGADDRVPPVYKGILDWEIH